MRRTVGNTWICRFHSVSYHTSKRQAKLKVVAVREKVEMLSFFDPIWKSGYCHTMAFVNSLASTFFSFFFPCFDREKPLSCIETRISSWFSPLYFCFVVVFKISRQVCT